ncbi:MAG: hypothetical protein KF862_00845 [Chitinophagaceae bacterium]|nr:hypothetical protein [Chitinophagaceae bacterium]
MIQKTGNDKKAGNTGIKPAGRMNNGFSIKKETGYKNRLITETLIH